MRLEYLDPETLTPNENNWRAHPEPQLSALTDAIREVGWAGACLYNEATGRLIDGHARKKVALDQGADKIPVLVGSWTEEQERLILSTLDPLAAMAGADAAKLDALLKEISPSSEALSSMLAGLKDANPLPTMLPEPGAGGDDFDTAAALDGDCRVKRGDLWVIDDKHRLLCGDCTDGGNVALVMDGEKAGVLLTDPPYAVDYVEKARDMNGRGYPRGRHRRRRRSGAVVRIANRGTRTRLVRTCRVVHMARPWACHAYVLQPPEGNGDTSPPDDHLGEEQFRHRQVRLSVEARDVLLRVVKGQ